MFGAERPGFWEKKSLNASAKLLSEILGNEGAFSIFTMGTPMVNMGWWLD